jgi:hypothetical protein
MMQMILKPYKKRTIIYQNVAKKVGICKSINWLKI